MYRGIIWFLKVYHSGFLRFPFLVCPNRYSFKFAFCPCGGVYWGSENHRGGVGMILQTGFRTDIPAFYSEWFANRLRAGYVLVRNPYNPQAVTRYELNPDMVGKSKVHAIR